MEKRRVLIIGYGTIGSALHETLLSDGRWDVTCLLNGRQGWLTGTPGTFKKPEPIDLNRILEKVQLDFLAIPTKDDGVTAKRYMKDALERKIPVVTCEKGALANHFNALEPDLDKIGYGATVGGGSGIIDFVRSRRSYRTREAHVILNGTLNFIWTGLQEGMPLERAVMEARAKGFADPGEEDPVRLILQEALRDAPMKAAILYNLGFKPQAPLKAKDFAMHLNEDALWRAIRSPGSWRFVVSYQNLRIRGPYSDLDNIIAFTAKHEEWSVIGGFKRVTEDPITRLCEATRWEQNGALMIEGKDGSGGTTLCVGVGAGPGPTTAAMIRDAERLLAPR